VAPGRERKLDRGGERSLLGPGLEARKRGGQRSAGAECVAHNPRGYASERMFPSRLRRIVER
jgi:hypothetical protein